MEFCRTLLLPIQTSGSILQANLTSKNQSNSTTASSEPDATSEATSPAASLSSPRTLLHNSSSLAILSEDAQFPTTIAPLEGTSYSTIPRMQLLTPERSSRQSVVYPGSTPRPSRSRSSRSTTPLSCARERVSVTGTPTGGSFLDARSAQITTANCASTVDAESTSSRSSTRPTSPTSLLTLEGRGLWHALGQVRTQLPARTTTTKTACSKKPDYKKNWLPLFLKNRWTSMEKVAEAIRLKHQDAMEFLESLTHRDKFKTVVSELTFQARLLERYLTYGEAVQECIQDLDSTTLQTGDLRSIITTESTEVFDMVQTLIDLFKQNVTLAYDYDVRRQDYWFVMSRVYYCLCGKLGKKRGLLLEGPPSSGKSFLTTVLCSVYSVHQIGVFVGQSARSSFWLQNLIGKAIYVGEEIKLDPLTAQTVKLLLEGSEHMQTDVKFADGVELPYRPTIITSNGECYQLVSAESGAYHERSVELTFKHPFRINCTRDRAVQARAWSLLMNECKRRYPMVTRNVQAVNRELVL